MLTTSQISDYATDGVVVLRNFLTPETIEILRKGIEMNLANLSSRAKVASSENDPGFFVEDFCNWSNNPHYQEVIFRSKLAQAACELMQSQTVRLYHDHMLVKEPLTQQPTPWHQDQPYYNIDGHQNCSMWIPVDPVSRSSTLEFVKGSHLGPWLMPRSFMSNEAKWFPEGTLADLPDIEQNREKFPIVGWEMNVGDIVCFHMLTLHSSKGVDGLNRRRAFSIRFIGMFSYFNHHIFQFVIINSE
jgi:ectoine hydroxylase-related dioxygenase (phytanoyl-CoA dioxygenase family)